MSKNLLLISFIFVVLIALLGISFLSIPIGSDPGRIWYFSKIFLTSGAASAFSTLEPWVSVTLYASLMSLFGGEFPLAVIQGISSGLVLLTVFNYLYKSFGLRPAFYSVLIFCSSFIFWERATSQVPYPLYLFFSVLGVFSYINYRQTKSEIYIFLSSFFVAFAVFTFNLSLTLLVLIAAHCLGNVIFSKNKLKNEMVVLAKFYTFIFILLLPWFVWRVSAAGTDFYKNPYNWMIEKYWSKFSLTLWERPRPLSPEYFEIIIDTGFVSLTGTIVLIIPALLGLTKIQSPLLFALWLISPLLPFLVGKLPAEPRYLYGMLPPLAILAGIGLSQLVDKIKPTLKLVATNLILLILMTFTIQNLIDVYQRQTALKDLRKELFQFKAFFRPDEYVFFRSLQFQPLFSENPMVSPPYMDEQDAIKLLGWTSESDVSQVIQKYNLSWVILYADKSLEDKFSSWISMADANLSPKHYVDIENSRLFKKKISTPNYLLYEVIN